MKKSIISALTAAVVFAAFPASVMAQDGATVQTAEEATRQSSWYGKPFAVDGQDVVSYQTENGPVAGSQEFTANWDNTEWRFASAENRDLFLNDPDRYVPQFGGYCPVALAQGHAKIGTARHFNVVDEKLYLNINRRAQNSFDDNPVGYIAAAKVTF